jgi:Uma2 family endonuclease
VLSILVREVHVLEESVTITELEQLQRVAVALHRAQRARAFGTHREHMSKRSRQRGLARAVTPDRREQRVRLIGGRLIPHRRMVAWTVRRTCYFSGVSHPAAMPMSYGAYLAAERTSETRHEYVDGVVHAMAGGTPEHAALAAAVARALGNALDGKPCRVFSSDLRVRVVETGLATYPDVSVICGHLDVDVEDPDAAVNPIVLVEVLSDSSEAFDRGAKAAHYRRIPSLREYVLVSHSERRIEVHRRNASGQFEVFDFAEGTRVELVSIGAGFDVAAVYMNPLAT